MTNRYLVDTAVKSDDPIKVATCLRKYYRKISSTYLTSFSDSKPIIRHASLTNITENTLSYIISVSSMLIYENENGIIDHGSRDMIVSYCLRKLYNLGKFSLLKDELYKLDKSLSLYITKSDTSIYYVGDELTKWIHINCKELEALFPLYYPRDIKELTELEDLSYDFRLSKDLLCKVDKKLIEPLLSWRNESGNRYVPSEKEITRLRKKKAVWKRYKASLC